VELREPQPGAGRVAAIYPRALPQVYGYLVARCGSAAVAEDLTAETFVAAVRSERQGAIAELTVAWLVGIARHKLVDHWRRVEREQRSLAATEPLMPMVDDPWDARLDIDVLHIALTRVPPMHRLALTLRYLDGLSVAEVADHVGRSLNATETLLVRARATLRRVYREEEPDA
jgi:RNA polymerase sigma-70 factor (ECF subfamily)